MEHIEQAGVHSGDSACCLPPHSIGDELVRELHRQTILMAKALDLDARQQAEVKRLLERQRQQLQRICDSLQLVPYAFA